MRIVVRDYAGGDQLPENGELVTYTMDQGSLPPDPAIALPREHPDDLRLATFNVLFDSPWDGGEEPRFERLVAAADPDIICFQEIYDHSASQTAALVGSWLPGDWSAADNSDSKTVTRRPILGLVSPGGGFAGPALFVRGAPVARQLLTGPERELDPAEVDELPKTGVGCGCHLTIPYCEYSISASRSMVRS